eukprot:3014156-Rhodomonas_salina.1
MHSVAADLQRVAPALCDSISQNQARVVEVGRGGDLRPSKAWVAYIADLVGVVRLVSRLQRGLVHRHLVVKVIRVRGGERHPRQRNDRVWLPVVVPIADGDGDR